MTRDVVEEEEWNDEQVHSPHVKSPHDMCPSSLSPLSCFVNLLLGLLSATQPASGIVRQPDLRNAQKRHRIAVRAHLSLAHDAHPFGCLPSPAQPSHPTDVNDGSSAPYLSPPPSPGSAARMAFESKSKSSSHLWRAPPSPLLFSSYGCGSSMDKEGRSPVHKGGRGKGRGEMN